MTYRKQADFGTSASRSDQQVTPSNGPTDWQENYEELSERSRRIVHAQAAE